MILIEIGFIIVMFKYKEGKRMNCRSCKVIEINKDSPTKVIDVRKVGDGTMVKRRRECLVCGERFSTFEEIFERKK